MELIPIEQRVNKIINNNIRLYISAWKRDGDTISILVNKSDTTISDPIFTNPEQNKRRVVKKSLDEGQDYSAHIIIRLPQDNLEDALMLVEHCIGLPLSVLEILFNQLLANAQKTFPLIFEQNHPDGSLDEQWRTKKINVTCTCELMGHISDQLNQDLEEGKIHDIVLMTSKEKNVPFDEEGYMVKHHETLVVKVKDEGNFFKDKYKKLTRAIKTNHGAFEKFKICFTPISGQKRTVCVETNDMTAQSYVKRAKLCGFLYDLQSSYSNFCDEITTKMIKLINDKDIN